MGITSSIQPDLLVSKGFYIYLVGLIFILSCAVIAVFFPHKVAEVEAQVLDRTHFLYEFKAPWRLAGTRIIGILFFIFAAVMIFYAATGQITFVR